MAKCADSLIGNRSLRRTITTGGLGDLYASVSINLSLSLSLLAPTLLYISLYLYRCNFVTYIYISLSDKSLQSPSERKWKLDPTEDSLRRRLKLQINWDWDDHKVYH